MAIHESYTVDESKYRSVPRLTMKCREHAIIKTDAPEGFYPVSKDTIVEGNGNVCNFCEWRKQCNAFSSLSEKEKAQGSCMSYSRKDGIGVIFKNII